MQLFFYYRGCSNLRSDNRQKAIADLDKSIRLAEEDNIPKKTFKDKIISYMMGMLGGLIIKN